MKILKSILILSFVASFSIAISQNDTLIANDNTVLVGEIKEMSKGIITMETSFSESDFKIDYKEVKLILSKRIFRISLSNGDRYFGTITIDTIKNHLRIFDEKKGSVVIQNNDLIYLKQIGQSAILNTLNLALDLGYSYTNSNKLHQFNGSIHLDYFRRKWGITGKFNIVNNVQENADETKRLTSEAELKIFHKRSFFSTANIDFFSNNEQQLNLRSTYNLSFGKYFTHTNRIHFSSSIGLAYSTENYTDTIQSKESLEGKLKLEYNMFKMGDLNLFTSISFFPSITEKYSLRSHLKMTLKYDLPRAFYIKGNIDFHYDNKPIAGNSPDDYVYTLGIGWSL